MPRTPSFNEADVSDKPSFLQFPTLAPATVADLDERWRDALRSLQAVDEAIGAVYSALRDSGKLSKTYIVFTSDNGHRFGEHRLPSSAQSAFKPDIRVPLVVSGPSVLSGQIDLTHLIVNADIAPTMLALIGLTIPDLVDGRAFHRLLKGRELSAPWRNALPLAHRQETLGQTTWMPAFQGVHTQRFTYVEWAGGQTELYDLQSDPDELQNRASDPSLAGVQAQLTELAQRPAPCRQ